MVKIKKDSNDVLYSQLFMIIKNEIDICEFREDDKIPLERIVRSIWD